MIFSTRDRSKAGAKRRICNGLDCIYVNCQEIPTAGFLPSLEAILHLLAKAKASKEVYCFLTHMRIYTPKRLIQEGTDN